MSTPVIANSHSFWLAAQFQAVCFICGKPGDFHAHHVVDKQLLRREYGRTGDALYDTRNAMRLHRHCHFQFENSRIEIPLKKLKDEMIEYAVEVMGLRAYDYLKRYYSGDDERVEAIIA